jgi:hypothetical protein
MAEVFKKQIIRYTLNGKRVTASTPGAVRIVELSAKWYGTVDGTPVPLCSDKGKAQKILAARINNAALASVGLADPFAAHKQKSLDEHLKDYAGHLEAKGDTSRHISLTVAGDCVVQGVRVPSPSGCGRRAGVGVADDHPPGRYCPRDSAG